MSSYYERVAGTIEPSQIAQSEDIHAIQTNIQKAFQEMITDIFGNGCILDEGEEILKLTPVPYHIDQENKNFDEDGRKSDYLISFYDRYFRQKITIEKSEIQAIRVQMCNNTNMTVTVFAEIKDMDMNLVQEAHTELASTINESDPVDVTFNFNKEHLPVGDYYFIIRPVDISSTDLGDVETYSVITPDDFTIKYDRTGSYDGLLEASYNGVDYLNANELDDQVEYNVDEDIAIVNENNYDLYFEHIYSNGNTYVITPGACLVMGQKTYPIDTHVTIDGPSKDGDRTDLVTLTSDGELHVTKGEPYTGKRTENNYPIATAGFKVAYITTYQNSASTWICPNCNTENDGNAESCAVCDTTTNNKIPLIEQDDDNGITRQRDVLERLRRLENKMNYQIENNSPSRIKYTCTVDPTLAVNAKEINGVLIPAEDSYGMSSYTNDNGETILTFDANTPEFPTWSIVKQITTTTTSKKTTYIDLDVNNVEMPVKKPKKTYSSEYLNIEIKEKIYTTSTVKEKSTSGTSKEVTKTYKKAKANVPVTIQIKTKNGVLKKTIKGKKTNSKGKIQIDLWQYKLAKGEYWVYTDCHGKKLKTTIKVTEKGGVKTNDLKNLIQHKDIDFTETGATKTSTNVGNNVYVGDDGFSKDNISFNDETGEVSIAEIQKNNPKPTSWFNLTNKDVKNVKTHDDSFKIESNSTSQQSTYAMFSFKVDNKCTIYSITPYIKSFTNIEKFKIVLFENNEIFALKNNKKSYVKQIATSKAKNTNFSNKYESPWATVAGMTKYKKVTPKKQYTFNDKKIAKGIELEPGTYSIVILGKLKDTKKDGKITIKAYKLNKPEKHGIISNVKGTYNPSKIFIEKNSKTEKTFTVKMSRYVHTHNTSGTLTSKILTTKNGIRVCKLADANLEIPSGCSAVVQVSNNGGRNYKDVKTGGQVAFSGLGNQFRWRLVLTGGSKSTPKLKFDAQKKYAIRFELIEEKVYVPYEDYGRCFSTPLLNAHAITRSLAQNERIVNRFEEWEFCRLWMEDPEADSTMDICFAYDDNNYDTNVESSQSDWIAKNVFFSQTLSNLTVNDFSQNSVDYSNYDADVEYDENNFRLKYDPEMYNAGETVIATPLSGRNAGIYDYAYGDITNDDYDMSNFDYGLMDITTVYYDNQNSPETKYSGVHVLAGPYYQALYKPPTESTTITTEPTTTEPTTTEPTTTENNTSTNDTTTSDTEVTNDVKDVCWAQDGGDPSYVKDACIIGVSFIHGIEIKDQYTSLTFDLFANLRDCVEEEGEKQVVGTLKYYTPPTETETTSEGSESNDTSTSKYREGDVMLDEDKKGQNKTKYIDAESGFYYIPANTLELVVSLNQYGLIEDDNATYGKAYPIDIDLRSCQHTPFTIDLSDLYGATIYSFGVRVSENATWTEENNPDWVDGNSAVPKTIIKHPSLHENDILGLGNISFGSDNICPYTPYYTTLNQSRRSWEKIDAINESSIGYGNDIKSVIFNINANDEPVNTSQSRKLFGIETNINLKPYNWVNVEYTVDNSTAGWTEGSIMKGEIILDLYDTTEYQSTEPIESLPLPAWGRVQNNSVVSGTKIVHSWFKLHSNANKVKYIIIRRGNPTGRQFTDLKLVIQDIVFLNTESVPALGPQMQIRIYPQDEKALVNTKIRKFGCIYRLG